MILSFGELLLRFSPDAQGEWLRNNAVEIFLGGSEFNVAAALAKWKMPVSYCTALPKNFLSANLVKEIERLDIDVSTIQYCGDKLGAYYLEMGATIQHAAIVYDRLHSSFYELKPGMIDWNNVLNGVRWFHFSAICPALNQNVAAVCTEAVEFCAKKNITVSVDLNYRPKLWQYGKKPIEIMPALAAHCDIVMGNIWSAETMLGIPVPGDIHAVNTKENYVQQARISSAEIIRQFPKCKLVANTFRFHKTGIEYFATIFSENNLYISATYKTDSVTDKVGSGDCFMAGLIYGTYNHLPFQQLVNFAAGAAFQKLFIKGDFTNKTAEEVKAFIRRYQQQ